MLPPSAIASVSVVCALGPWVFSEALVLRGLAAAAAVTAVSGAVVMRRWDIQAGKRVADLVRARASDEWQHEERVAELETDLEESRELRGRLEQKLRAKRSELAGLRNEHAALLRRYATAETERASALEGRRLLEMEASAPARALPPVPVPAQAAPRSEAVGAAGAAGPAGPGEGVAGPPAEESGHGADVAGRTEKKRPAVFSPEGSELYRRARAALAGLDPDEPGGPRGPAGPDAGGDGDGSPGGGGGAPGGRPARAGAGAGVAGTGERTAREDGTRGKAGAADAQERGAAGSAAHAAAPRTRQDGQGAGRSGHFTVPTAVAVVPQAPARRPSAGGGFDFFGAKQPAPERADALETVQNEDLADVVGQEALALHKAESEAAFKPADADIRENPQVIDLTAHDETEQIDLDGLRSAVS